MQDVLLLVSIVAVFVFGGFLMKRLDEFFEKNKKAQEELFEIDENALRIGFANPFAADSFSDILEQYSEQYPDISIFLFYDAAEVLLKKMMLYKLDIVILPEQVEIPLDKDYNRREIMLTLTPLNVKSGEFAIEPEVFGSSRQIVLWIKQNQVPAVEVLTKYMDGTSRMN